jgi:uncharacterized protein (DUF3084 family)
MSDNWLQILLTAIVALPGIGALILQLRKNKPEIKKIETETEKLDGADTTETFAKALDIAGKKNIELYDRIDKIEEKVEYLANACVLKDREIAKLEYINQEKDKRILDLEKIIKEYEVRIKNLEKEVFYLQNNKED